jgi:glycine/D-amino acid oxidase-like deaminating enzyme
MENPEVKSSESVRVPEERVSICRRTEVLVVGGGAAGISAAVGASRLGAEVALIERCGHLGGLATGGLVILLLTLDDGDGHQVVGGNLPRSRGSSRGAWGSNLSSRAGTLPLGPGTGGTVGGMGSVLG